MKVHHLLTGGMMPSEDLFSHFANDSAIGQQGRVNGLQDGRTCEKLIENLDRFREGLLDRDAGLSLRRWRLFFMACAELFQYRGGDEWFVPQYCFQLAETESSRPRSPRVNQLQPTSQRAHSKS